MLYTLISQCVFRWSVYTSSIALKVSFFCFSLWIFVTLTPLHQNTIRTWPFSECVQVVHTKNNSQCTFNETFWVSTHAFSYVRFFIGLANSCLATNANLGERIALYIEIWQAMKRQVSRIATVLHFFKRIDFNVYFARSFVRSLADDYSPSPRLPHTLARREKWQSGMWLMFRAFFSKMALASKRQSSYSTSSRGRHFPCTFTVDFLCRIDTSLRFYYKKNIAGTKFSSFSL